MGLLERLPFFGGTRPSPNAQAGPATPQARPSSPGPHPALRILPIGDSLTLGFQSPDLNGYRLSLQQALAPVANTVFVGTQHGGTMTNNAHEGYNAKAISEIQTLSAKAVTTLKPDVILLLAGTNDVVANPPHQNCDEAPARLEKFITNLTSVAPHTTIIAAQIINTSDAKAQKRVEAFNKHVPGIVEKFAKAGKKVGLVDLRSVHARDLIDGVHPKPEAYKRIGILWFHAMRHAAKQGLLDVPQLKKN